MALVTGIKVTHSGFSECNRLLCWLYESSLDVHKSVSVLAEGSEQWQSCFKRLQFYFLILDLLWSWMQMMARDNKSLNKCSRRHEAGSWKKGKDLYP